MVAQMKGWTSAHLPGAEQPATPQRTNRKNDGRAFQEDMQRTFEAYAKRGIATVSKVDPPVRVFWLPDKATGRKTQRIIFQKNPWLDYSGCWTARHGRALHIEAKAISKHLLRLNHDGGIKESQIAAMYRWRRAGAAVALLWRFEGNIHLFTPEMIQAALATGAKSLKFEDGLETLCDEGYCDFLYTLEKALWPA